MLRFCGGGGGVGPCHTPVAVARSARDKCGDGIELFCPVPMDVCEQLFARHAVVMLGAVATIHGEIYSELRVCNWDVTGLMGRLLGLVLALFQRALYGA